MKTKLIFAAIALSCVTRLLAETALAASSPFAGELAVNVVSARVPVNGDSVAHGTSRVMVSLRLGSPNVVLPDGSWLYRGYEAQGAGGRQAHPLRHAHRALRLQQGLFPLP
jgi:hypothetical protein